MELECVRLGTVSYSDSSLNIFQMQISIIKELYGLFTHLIWCQNDRMKNTMGIIYTVHLINFDCRHYVVWLSHIIGPHGTSAQRFSQLDLSF
jgi:hypothetical protein